MNGGLKRLSNIVTAGVAMFALKKTIEKGRDAMALSAALEEDYAFTATLSGQIDFEKDWIVDSGSSSHFTGDVKNLQDFSDYEGPSVMTTANNSKFPIAHVGNAVVSFKSSNDKLPLQVVYHVPGTRGNIISVSKLTSSGYFVLFGPQDVKLYRELKIREEPVIKGRMLKSLYVISAE